MTYQELYEQLISRLKQYHPSKDFTKVELAYKIALEAHGEQRRESGELYINHPLSVSCILTELELDLESIISGILHDVIEDTEYSYDDIVNMFGDEVAQIVDGVTKLDKTEYVSQEAVQADNYRKMFLAMARDIRVILIKIADRLHNMRTLKYRATEKQVKVAQETLDIYAPLAHRLGISKIRYELEDLAFQHLNPDAYSDLSDRIKRKQSERQEFIDNIVNEIRERLIETGIKAYVEGRPKHFFSIYKKMIGQGKTLDQIFDLFALRVIVEEVRECYEVLGVVHEMYTPVPGRFKDYINLPKTNRYQSLHTTLISAGGEPFEVQIRTWEMHRTSEYGIAAHWKYKEGTSGQANSETEEAKLSWLRKMLDWQRDLSDNREYLDALKVDLNVFKEHVYCFTPKGEVVSLISGSTPVDFAYAIHSAVGNRMIGAKVNGKIENFDYALKTGDRVQILTSQNTKGPSLDWLNMVKTSQAKSKINQWFKKESKEDNILKGKDLLEREARHKGLALSDLLNEEFIKIVVNRFSCQDWDTLCAAIGHGGVKEGQVINRLYEEYQKLTEKNKVIEIEDIELDVTDSTVRNRKKRSGIAVKGIGDINVRFSKCCSPVPGDEIVGFVTRGRGVSIHRTDCANILNLEEADRQRIIDAEWQLPEKVSNPMYYRADFRIIGADKVGLLADVSRILSDEKMPVKAMTARTVDAEAVFDVGIEIKSRAELDTIINKIKKLSGVYEIERT